MRILSVDTNKTLLDACARCLTSYIIPSLPIQYLKLKYIFPHEITITITSLSVGELQMLKM